MKVWEERIVEYVGKRDEQTIGLATKLDQLQRRGVDAERGLDLAVRREPLPVDRATAALAYRVQALTTPKRPRREVPLDERYSRPAPRSSGPSLGM